MLDQILQFLPAVFAVHLTFLFPFDIAVGTNLFPHPLEALMALLHVGDGKLGHVAGAYVVLLPVQQNAAAAARWYRRE